MTWKELKQKVEGLGVVDEMELEHAEVNDSASGRFRLNKVEFKGEARLPYPVEDGGTV
jgi:hypothetical protein